MVPRARSERSKASAGSLWSVLLSFVTKKISSLGTPDALIPAPTSFSFPEVHQLLGCTPFRAGKGITHHKQSLYQYVYTHFEGRLRLLFPPHQASIAKYLANEVSDKRRL